MTALFAPSSWKLVRLAEAAEVTMGNSPPGDSYNETGDGIPLINGPVEFSEGDFGQTIRSKFTTSPTRRCKKDDLLLCVRGSTTGRTNIAGFDACIGRGVASIRARGDQAYLNHFIRTQRQRLFDIGNGSTFPSITQEQLVSVEVPIPSLPEQRRIAAILDKADAIRRKREEGIRLTEELLRSTFLEMFGDPATNPRKWEIRVMDELVRETQYGTAEKSNSDCTGIPVLRMNNITYSGEIDLSDVKWCVIKDADLEQLTVKRGDLLFNRTNSPELVGKTAVWDRDERYAYAGYLFRVRFDERMVLPDYVSAFLNSAYGKKMLFARAKPSNNMSNFSAGEFCRIEMPVPNIVVQRKFTEFVAEAKKSKGKRQLGLKDSNFLFDSLVQRAFREEL
jgi:type I restriction enzyme S subunit